jgi:hypothetical protein
MKYIKLFENFEQIEKYELKDGKLDLNDKNKFCKLIDGPFLEKNPDWENMPLIADDFFNSLLRITNVITGERSRAYLNEVVPITEEEWELLKKESETQSEKNDKPYFSITSDGRHPSMGLKKPR